MKRVLGQFELLLGFIQVLLSFKNCDIFINFLVGSLIELLLASFAQLGMSRSLCSFSDLVGLLSLMKIFEFSFLLLVGHCSVNFVLNSLE